MTTAQCYKVNVACVGLAIVISWIQRRSAVGCAPATPHYLPPNRRLLAAPRHWLYGLLSTAELSWIIPTPRRFLWSFYLRPSHDVNHCCSNTTLTPRPRCFRSGNLMDSNFITRMLYAKTLYKWCTMVSATF